MLSETVSEDLLGQAPRAVERRGPLPGRLTLWLNIPNLLLSLVFVAWLFHSLLLLYLGTDILARVTASDVTRTAKSTSYHVNFEGHLADGTLVTGRLNRDNATNTTVGELVPVRVLPIGSYHALCNSRDDANFQVRLATLFSVGWLGFILARFYLPILLPVWRQRSLVVNGTPIAGKIVKRRQETQGCKTFNILTYRIEYRHSRVEADMEAYSLADYERLVEGTTVTVLVAQDPWKGAIYEACQYQVVTA